jgi:hypothetical protein
LFSVVHVLASIVEYSDALLTAIGCVDAISTFKSLSIHIDGVAICPAETTGVIPTIKYTLLSHCPK